MALDRSRKGWLAKFACVTSHIEVYWGGMRSYLIWVEWTVIFSTSRCVCFLSTTSAVDWALSRCRHYRIGLLDDWCHRWSVKPGCQDFGKVVSIGSMGYFVLYIHKGATEMPGSDSLNRDLLVPTLREGDDEKLRSKKRCVVNGGREELRLVSTGWDLDRSSLRYKITLRAIGLSSWSSTIPHSHKPLQMLIIKFLLLASYCLTQVIVLAAPIPLNAPSVNDDALFSRASSPNCMLFAFNTRSLVHNNWSFQPLYRMPAASSHPGPSQSHRMLFAFNTRSLAH